MNKTCCILYNPKAGNGTGETAARKLNGMFQNVSPRFEDITKVEDYYDFFQTLSPQDQLIVAGGDGTLNRFVNETNDIRENRPIWYYPTGSGNDFWKDIGQNPGDKPVNITQYLTFLPKVTVRGETRIFLNGVGYGIDGYCCEIGDKMREVSKKAINYTAIAVKGLLFHYHPTEATVIADGKEQTYQKVWLAPTMFGRFYGGGMMPTPAHRSILDKAKGYQQKLASTASAWQRLGALGTLAAGSVGEGGKLSFDRYVMGTVFREILEMANRRINTMSGGKYELIHKMEADRKNTKAGLEIEVLDTSIGKARPSSLLSGGEGFYASLSLALGLSDVVQNHVGGKKLDALFIDEGFGTLSPDVLDKALEVLNQLTEGNRLVGIISHVDKLDESIPQKIRVTFNEKGSHLQQELS